MYQTDPLPCSVLPAVPRAGGDQESRFVSSTIFELTRQSRITRALRFMHPTKEV